MHHLYWCAGRTLLIGQRAEAGGRHTHVNFVLALFQVVEHQTGQQLGIEIG